MAEIKGRADVVLKQESGGISWQLVDQKDGKVLADSGGTLFKTADDAALEAGNVASRMDIIARGIKGP